MLKRVDTDATPPGGFRYRVDPQGKLFSGWSKGEVIRAVASYLTSNGLSVPTNLSDLVEHFTCEQNHGVGCEEDNPLSAFRQILVMNWQVIKAGTLNVGTWVVAGKPMVSQELADSRGSVCRDCTYNESPRGCMPCQLGALHDLVVKLVGAAKCSSHDKLQACSRCGCALRAKIWLPIEFLTKAEPALPLPDWCWMKKEADNG